MLRQSQLTALEKRAAACHPAARLQFVRARTEILAQRMRALAEKRCGMAHAQWTLLSDKLKALGPREALGRGYAVVLAGKSPVTSVRQAQENMTLLLQDGRVRVRTVEVREEDPFAEETADL